MRLNRQSKSFLRSFSTRASRVNFPLEKGLQFDGKSLPKELAALIPADNAAFLNALDEAQQRFYPKYLEVRQARPHAQKALRDAVEAGTIDYRKDLAWIRNSDWKVGPIPEVLQQRPVEITGPANDAAMVIDAFNTASLAKNVIPGTDLSKPVVKFMPDSEDCSIPSLAQELQGILNIKLALEGKLTHLQSNADGTVKKTSVGSDIAYPIFRVPGIHLDEATMVDRYNRPIPNHLLLTLLYQFHLAPLMVKRGWVPSIYQPKLQSYEEAVLVNDLIAFSEQAFGIAPKSTRVTVLIETLSGALQAEEITYGLKDYVCALNAGRWDYLFQWIQILQNTITPDRFKITMQTKHMEAYMDHIRDVCDRRGHIFMGGMSPVIPGPKIGAAVYERIAADKKHEMQHGAHGAWVAHPGMVEQVLKLFTEKAGVEKVPRRAVKASELVTLEPALQEVSQRTEASVEANISVGVQYLASWFAGRGAAALNNLLEELAIAEISRTQLWQWMHLKTTFTLKDGSVVQFTPEAFDKIFDRVIAGLQVTNEVGYAAEFLPKAAALFRDLVKSEKLDDFIVDRAYTDINHDVEKLTARRDLFAPVSFNNEDMVELLPGVQHHGEELVKMRTRYFRDLFSKSTASGHPRQFWFAGTSNPLVGSSTVLGGGGNVGSYLGGWDANAVNNVLNKRLPDTLNVWVNDSTNGAKAINNHLRRDMELDNLDYTQKLAKLSPAERASVRVPFNWLAVPQLVDLEQGWRSIHHIRLAVDSAIDNGINFVHIEDQGHHKRCGHLGDKELAPFDSYCQILRSANLTAAIRLGEEQKKGLGMVFVARTDAYSAKRIEFSTHLSDPKHIDHPFVDFARGVTEDGKYYHLKQGVNPATGNTYGLDLAITRMAEVVHQGLAEYVWMETPNADLHTAKSFIDGVNAKLLPFNQHAKMLYNHSPSFDWDLGFVKGATKLGNDLIKHVKDVVAPTLRNIHAGYSNQQYATSIDSLRTFVKANGDAIQRDFDFSDATLQEILLSSLDLTGADKVANANVVAELSKVFPGARVQAALNALQTPVDTLESQNRVYRAIADARLGLFGKASAAVGVELPLTTLPDFHYEAFAAHKLAMGLVESSMQAYVHQVQRPERKHFEAQKDTAQPYPFYKHQESTGTGVDARFGKLLGSSDTKALEESTEADDLKDRAALEAELLKKKV